jgi:hypothetical protein
MTEEQFRRWSLKARAKLLFRLLLHQAIRQPARNARRATRVLPGRPDYRDDASNSWEIFMGLFSSDTKTNPFGDAEERMHKKMMEAEGGSVDETFARKMIEHHQGGIETSEILIREGSDPELKSMAEKTMEHQRMEIEQLRSWLGRPGA